MEGGVGRGRDKGEEDGEGRRDWKTVWRGRRGGIRSGRGKKKKGIKGKWERVGGESREREKE